MNMMKKIVFLFLAMSAMMATHAQGLPYSNEIDKINNHLKNNELDSANNQIKNLKKIINNRYKEYKEDKDNQLLYTNEQFRQYYFKEWAKKKASLLRRISMLKDTIETTKTKIHDSVSSTPIDTLFSHCNPISLRVYKQIFGENYPSVMDELQILLECSEALKKKYDEEQIQTCLQKCQRVRECPTKEYLEGLLSLYKDINDEVALWLLDKDYSLYSMAIEIAYINDNFGIDLEFDFPYLANKIRGTVQKKMKEEPQKK